SLREKLLLDAAKELLGIELVFRGSGTPQNAHMQDDDIAAARLDAVQDGSQMVERVNVADGNENISRARADGFGSQRALHLQMELIHLDVLRAAALVLGVFFRDRENHEERNRE